MDRSFLVLFFKKERHFFFEKKKQKTSYSKRARFILPGTHP